MMQEGPWRESDDDGAAAARTVKTARVVGPVGRRQTFFAFLVVGAKTKYTKLRGRTEIFINRKFVFTPGARTPIELESGTARGGKKKKNRQIIKKKEKNGTTLTVSIIHGRRVRYVVYCSGFTTSRAPPIPIAQ